MYVLTLLTVDRPPGEATTSTDEADQPEGGHVEDETASLSSLLVRAPLDSPRVKAEDAEEGQQKDGDLGNRVADSRRSSREAGELRHKAQNASENGLGESHRPIDGRRKGRHRVHNGLEALLEELQVGPKSLIGRKLRPSRPLISTAAVVFIAAEVAESAPNRTKRIRKPRND